LADSSFTAALASKSSGANRRTAGAARPAIRVVLLDWASSIVDASVTRLHPPGNLFS
jgi:hypothetical protein